jgi:hypothetical protein
MRQPSFLKRPWLAALTATLGVMFAVFAYVQLNDTNPEIYDRPSVLDAWSWMFFYGFIAVLCIVSIFRRVPRVLLGVAAAFCLFEMARTVPGLYANLFEAEKFSMTATSMTAAHPEVELTREFFGALIGLFGVGFLWWQASKAERR